MKKVFFLLVLFVFTGLVQAQVAPPVSSANGSTTSVMPTGNSGAMANQTHQVDLSTGGLSLSIPIYSLGSRQLSTNVSLSYQTPTSSFWYNEYPSSWVGRDWVLNAGGVIVREVTDGYRIDSLGLLQVGSSTLNQYDLQALLYDLINPALSTQQISPQTIVDYKPDIYYYNFDGYAGKFIYYIDRVGNPQVHTIPHSDLKFIPPNLEDERGVWKIYTPNGTLYTFGGDYVETTAYSRERYDYTVGVDGFGDEALYYRHHPLMHFPSKEVPTSWYLNKIIAPYNSDSITFEYGDAYTTSVGQSSIQHLVNYETEQEEVRRFHINTGEVKNQRRISKITSTTGSVEFIEEDSLIKSIEVRNKSQELIHRYELKYKKVDRDNFLISFQERISDCIKKPPYQFEYIALDGNPDTDYNGSGVLSIYLKGTLKKINYPEGGNTKFLYEHNTANVIEWEYKNVEEKIALVNSTAATYAERWIEIDHQQDLWLQALNHHGNNYSFTIYKTDGSIVFTRSVSADTEYTIPIAAGKYKIVIDYGRRLDNYSSIIPYVTLNLKWKRKWLSPNTNAIGTGIRVKKIIVHDGIDNSKNIVKQYKYELDNGNSSGRLITPPLIAPRIESNYDWRTGRFDAYTYSHYTYESETSLWNFPYTSADTAIHIYGKYDSLVMAKSYKVYTMPQYNIEGAGKIQYTKVIELYGENGEQGYVENYFSYDKNIISNSSPMITIEDNAWKRGLPIKTKVFDKDGKIISETINEYEFSSLATHPNQHKEIGKVSVIDRVDSYNPRIRQYYSFAYDLSDKHNSTAFRFGKITLGNVFLKKTTTTNYDQDHSGNSITSSTEYEYSDKHLFPIRVIQHESNGDKTISESKYVLDYDLDQTFTQDEASTLKNMRDKHIISPIIEQTIWKQKAGQARQLLGASLNTYKIYQTSILENNYMTSTANYKYYFALMPSITYSFEPTTTWQPISDTDFTFSSITPNGLEWDNRYKKRVEYLASDRYGNLLSTKEVNGVPSTTLWGYNRLFPVAQIAGASHRQVAYEGFESYGEQNPYPDLKTDASFRGKYSSGRFTGNYIEGLPLGRRYLIYPSSEPIPKGNYIFSFWAKGSGRINIVSSYSDNYYIDFTGDNNEWTYYEKDIFINNNELPNSSNQNYITYVVSGNLNLDMRIDEIRFHPKNSFMTTTTYKPLVGVTHTTDAEQRTSSYYYDPLRRVESVRDHKNNLIKSYEYKYMSEDDNPNPLFSISTNPTPEGLINTSVTALVNRTDFNRCLNSNQMYNHKWDFGDGSVSLIVNSVVSDKSHAYSQAGTYVITLSVEVVAGYWVDAHTSIRIIDPSAPSDLTNELTVTLGGTQDPTNSLCYDLVATPNGGTAPFTYEWLPGDGTSVPMQTGATLNYCYTTFGNFTPRVIVTDATGARAEATFDLTVTNPIEQLRAEIISNDEFCKGSCAFFEANVTGGSPSYTYQWQLIDPITNVVRTIGIEPTLLFKIPSGTQTGYYRLSLIVTDSEGRDVTTTKTANVIQNNSCPSTSLDRFIITKNAQPIDINAIAVGDDITFTSSYTSSRYRYTWKVLKDGVLINEFISQSPSLDISFPTEGNYTINCTVIQMFFTGGIGGFPNEVPSIVYEHNVEISLCSPITTVRF